MRKLEHLLPDWANQDVSEIGKRLFAALGGSGKPKVKDEDLGEELTLVATVSDVGYRLVLLAADGAVRHTLSHWSCVEAGKARPADALSHAAAASPGDGPLVEENIRSIVLLVDDPDLYLTDHRAARLSNYEPRALREFGVQQSGGRSVIFASRPYGETGEKELEKRVIAYLPEDRLEALFYPFGAKATALRVVAPAAAPSFMDDAADADPDAPAMSLRVHGYFSTLLVRAPESGVIAARNIPLGALTAASRYADEFGLTLEHACAALAERSRLTPAEAILAGDDSAEHRTAGFAAIAPFLQELHGEIAATLDYYRYERFGGRPARLDLSFTGPDVAGLADWLGEALDIEVARAAPDLSDPRLAAQAGEMNLLEGVRPGLLTLGTQPYQFSGDGFRPVEDPRSRRAAAPQAKGQAKGQTKSAGGASAAKTEGGMKERLAALSGGKGDGKAGTPAWLGPAFLAAALPALAVYLNMTFLIAPAEDTVASRASSYGALIDQAPTDRTPVAEAPAPDPLWAENLVSVGAAMLPAMRLTRIELDGDRDERTLHIAGALPDQARGDLRLVAGFIDRLDKDASFARRFPSVEFAGLGQDDDPEEAGDADFRIVAVSEGAAE